MAVPALRPRVGERVDVTVSSDGAQLLAVVDDVLADGALVLRAPVDLAGADVDALPAGAALTVTWISFRGRHDLDVVLGPSSKTRDLWRLAAAGEARTTQLRRYARASDTRPARLVRAGDQWPAVVGDISEGGARCSLIERGEIHAGDRVVVHVTVESTDLALPAKVLEVTAQEAGRSQLRLEFADLGRTADVVRRHVLDQQRRARATT